jgi:hypothetical protein
MAGYALAGRQFAGTVPEFLEIQFVWGDALVGHVHSLVVVSVGEEPKPAKCAGATVKSRICGKYEVAVGGSRNGVEVADMGVSQGKNGANTASSMSVVDIKKLSRSGRYQALMLAQS